MCVLIFILAALPLTLAAETSGSCANPFEAAATPGGEMAMNLRAGDITIRGSDSAAIRVTCTLNNQHEAADIRISFAANHLTVRGGTDDHVAFLIEIPRSMNLRIRSTAGDLSVGRIKGNKDIEINAGNLTIEVGDAAVYRSVEASVWAGNLKAPAFGAEHNGLFRSFRRHNPEGSYRLHAELMAGNLTLR